MYEVPYQLILSTLFSWYWGYIFRIHNSQSSLYYFTNQLLIAHPKRSSVFANLRRIELHLKPFKQDWQSPKPTRLEKMYDCSKHWSFQKQPYSIELQNCFQPYYLIWIFLRQLEFNYLPGYKLASYKLITKIKSPPHSPMENIISLRIHLLGAKEMDHCLQQYYQRKKNSITWCTSIHLQWLQFYFISVNCHKP